MNWFKSLWLTSEEREILKKAKEEKQRRNVVETISTPEENKNFESPKRPYNKLLYSNGILTVIFHSGNIISIVSPVDIIEKVKQCKNEEEILDIIVPKSTEQKEEKIEKIEKEKIEQSLKSAYSVFDGNEDFIVKEDNVYLKNVNLKIPQAVLFSFVEILEKIEALEMRTDDIGEEYENLLKNYEALKMFWMWLSLSPLDKCRNDLLTFIVKNNVKITRNGNLVLYRRIVSVGSENESKEIVEFISTKYYNRKKQKKGSTHPRNYSVIRINGKLDIRKEGEIPETSEVLGNLNEMFKNLDNLKENTYTSYHNHGKLTIKVGSIYSIPDDEINLDNGLCAAGGIHAAAVDYNYFGFGDTPVVVLVNPSKAITVPRDETGKLRTTEMFIACVNNKPHGVHFDDADLTAFDEEYFNISLEKLEEIVSKKDFNELGISNNYSELKENEIVDIKEALKKRIKQIV